MLETKVFDAIIKPTPHQKTEIVEFLHTHLQEYGDPKKDIRKALDYALKEFGSFGGFVMLLLDDDNLVGVTIFNKTGMGGYIPENILVYIATHADYRGKGLGKKLMTESIAYAKGDVALHVEPNNPARHLYEKIGFTAPYLEMRLKR
jgi:ribosomal-protein-alanine N-acetyltransferase